MRIILDECLPKPLKRLLPDHEVFTVPEVGGAGLTNGALLAYMADRCDAFLTGDNNMAYQQRLADRPFAIVVLRSRSNRINDLAPLVPELLAMLPGLQAGEVSYIRAEPPDGDATPE